MPHCSCEGLEQCFGTQRAIRELMDYRKHGTIKTTRLLIEALLAEPISGMTLLDIGGGLGAIQHALLQAGVSQSLDVDASSAYLATAREEAERLGLKDRMRFVHGNFVEVAPSVPVADLVTLDRVICCFDDMPALVGLSAARSAKFYGVVIPRDTWWMQFLQQGRNLFRAITRTSIRFYVHPTKAIDAVVHDQGLERHVSRIVGMWQVIIYARSQPLSS
jgi:magnesium-protoporphyrin O-methyltransferase